jgi:hypothetical protein
MNKNITRVWTFASDSNPNIEYENLQYLDGSTSCNCMGWTRRVARDGTRSCKHLRAIHMGTADRICKATHNCETKNHDLPNEAEREAIWDIQIGKHGRDPKDFDMVQLAKATEGLTGSEIEQVFIEALYLAFDAGEKEPTDLDIARVLTEFVPLSTLMAEQITVLRSWAKGRARLATSTGEEKKGRRLMV